MEKHSAFLGAHPREAWPWLSFKSLVPISTAVSSHPVLPFKVTCKLSQKSSFKYCFALLLYMGIKIRPFFSKRFAHCKRISALLVLHLKMKRHPAATLIVVYFRNARYKNTKTLRPRWNHWNDIRSLNNTFTILHLVFPRASCFSMFPVSSAPSFVPVSVNCLVDGMQAHSHLIKVKGGRTQVSRNILI